MVLSPQAHAELPADLPHVNCDVIVAQSFKSGLLPKVTVDPNWGIARMTAEKNYCREPQEVWDGRFLPWPVVVAPDSEAPKYLLKQKEALTSKAEPEKPRPVAPTPSITSTPLAPPKTAPVVTAPVETTAQPSTPKTNPYLSGDRLPSIISGKEEIPETIKIEDGGTSIPKLADLVQSKMNPNPPQAAKKTETEPSPKDTGIDYLYLALWGAIGSLSLGFIVVLYFTLHKPKARVMEDEDEEEDA
ncbi:hypothetical protein BEN30_09760 [Magnetovibrio blakemorei]|uniref:Uncharacterized protein n=1 Tax=Magnetovibrio blakemorei TaxID=28181 RepID=A0A1E5Q7B4_9PROT|nr:hypothetical protein BEN30_09760 [Magnetovibrio blakemorei]